MQESQLNDKGYCKNCNGKVLCFSFKQMGTNNVLINTKKSLTNGIWNVYTSLTSSNNNVNIYKINRMVAHCKWLKASKWDTTAIGIMETSASSLQLTMM